MRRSRPAAIQGLLPPVPDGIQAAVLLGWGAPIAAISDEFNQPAVDAVKWKIYNGAGHGGNGTRSPAAIEQTQGRLTITGDALGNTGGMQLASYRQFGRWETRIRIPAGDDQYHAVCLLFPEEAFNPPTTSWPQGGEVDYAETSCANTQNHFFLHYSASNQQISAAQTMNITDWHNYAVEWSATSMTGWVDGVQWFNTTDTTKLPPGPQHQCLQLDWFPIGGPTIPSRMEIAWHRGYAAP